jgi:hypothetical protein
VRVLAAATSQNCDPNPRNNVSVQEITIPQAQGTSAPGRGGHSDRGGRGWPTRRDGH